MIPAQALDRGVDRGLISADQAAGLRRIAEEMAAGDPAASGPAATPAAGNRAEDEVLRFVTGFADIFVTIGILLFTGGLGYIVDLAAGLTAALWTVAAASWLLAEFFTRRRRMALPSIVLLVVFAASVLGGAVGAIGTDRFAPAGLARPGIVAGQSGQTFLLAGLVAVALSALHYGRFRVPITVAAGMAVVLLSVWGFIEAAMPGVGPQVLDALLFVWGCITFALAMRFDLADPGRRTRRTDIAFWLHLLAAPLVVHSFMRSVMPGFLAEPTPAAALLVLAIVLLLGLVALVIDRRAVLVSGLVYAGVAFGRLIRTFGLGETGLLIPAVILVLGACILLLSAGWHPLRRTLMSMFPAGLARRLPNPMVSVQS